MQAVSQVMGGQLADDLFGIRPKASVTYTRADVMKILRDKPAPAITSTLQNMIQEAIYDQELAKNGKRFTNCRCQ